MHAHSSLATCHSSTAEQDIPVVVLEYQSIPDGSSTSRAPNKTEWKDEVCVCVFPTNQLTMIFISNAGMVSIH